MSIKEIIELHKVRNGGLSNAEVAQSIGVNESTLHYWLWRDGIPRADKFKSLLDVTGVDIADVTFPSDTGSQASTHGRQSQRVSDGEPVPQEA